jgi:hypothetical protein
VRWPDRDERQWTAIAGVVETVARALIDGGHDVDEDDPAVALMPVDVAGLAPADRNIVISWFPCRVGGSMCRPVGGRADKRPASPVEHLAGSPGRAAAGLAATRTRHLT